MLKTGQLAPGFELPDAGMEMVSLKGYLGQWIVVLFFMRAMRFLNVVRKPSVLVIGKRNLIALAPRCWAFPRMMCCAMRTFVRLMA